MLGNVVGDGAARPERSGEDETNLALLKNIGSAIALAGFGAGVGNQAHAKRGAIIVSSLAGVADVKLDVISALEGKKVAARISQCWGQKYAMEPPRM